MSATVIFLVRHGETPWTRADRFCGSSDVDLAPEGLRQAEALARALRDVPFGAAYCSPLGRAVATATPTLTDHGLDLRIAADLRELDFGVWEGRRRPEIERDDPDRWRSWTRDPAAEAPERGETGYAVAGRAAGALLRMVEAHPRETLLVVAHKSVNRILLCHLLGLPILAYRDRIGQDTCALNRISIDSGGNARVTRLNETLHLRQDVRYEP